MLTSRSRSTGAGPDERVRGAALPRRVRGTGSADVGTVAVLAAADGAPSGDDPEPALDDVALGATDASDASDANEPGASEPDGRTAVLPAPDGAGLPDVSGLLARLVDERIPMALMVDLVNQSGPGPEDDDEAPSEVE